MTKKLAALALAVAAFAALPVAQATAGASTVQSNPCINCWVSDAASS